MHQNIIKQPIETPDVPADDAGKGLMRSINLRDLWAPIYRSRYAILAIFVIVFAAAVAATLLTQPQYRATATVEIRSETQKVLGTEERDEAGTSTLDASRFLDTQLEIIKSRATTGAVAQSLGLYNNDNFLTTMSVDPDFDGVANPREARRKLVNEVLLDNLRVSFSEETRIAEIKFSSPDPRLSQRVANSYADNYIRLNLARRFDASSYSLDFLRNQIREAQQRLGRSEREAIDYARRARLIDVSNGAGGTSQNSGGPQSLTTASLVGLNQSLSEAVGKRIAAEQRWNRARAGNLLAIPEVVSNPTVQQLQQQRALLRGQYEQELETRTEDYPAVRQLAARIAELGTQINSIAGSVRATLREDFATAQANERALRDSIEQMKATTLNEQDRSVQLSILRREASTNREQLDALLKRYNELNAQSGVQLNNLSVIDSAEVPGGPYWPSIPLNVALALIVSMLLSAIYVLGRENLFELVRTPEDVASRLRLPLLGAVPASEQVIEAMHDPKSSVSEAFNSIRTSLSLASVNGVPKSLAVTSTQAGEGKSTVCFGLVQGLVKLGRSVVIIDADLRRPNVHRVFNLQNKAGVSNILSGSATIEDCVVRDPGLNVDVITSGPIPPDAAELLAADRLGWLVNELAKRYDHVVVDSAPLLGLADAPLVAANVEGVVYVIEAARTGVRGVQSAINRLAQSGTPLLGVVLSRFDASKSGYSYEYRYAYEYSYGKDRTAA
jgi:polysaccharide biosynthesis transport protein